MKALAAFFVLFVVTFPPSQGMPSELLGKWKVRRTLNTHTISCWGDKEAKQLIGTEIEYTADSFRWANIVVKNPRVKVRMITAEEFFKEYSGGSASGSQVSFEELGIKAESAKGVAIAHPPADVTGGTVEIPGDVVLLKDKNTIVFSACNVYFEAKRVGRRAKPAQSESR